MTLSKTAERIWQFVRGSPAEVVRSFPMPRERVVDSGTIAERLVPRKHYFKLVMNEMFLSEEREWLNEWDPMALVVTEFFDEGTPITAPFVVGPSLVKLKEKVTGGFVLSNTTVAGPHRYSGGAFAVTIVLARVKRASYGRKVLEFLDNVANAVPAGAALAPNIKIAGAVIDGVEALFGMAGDTQAIAGHRLEYDDGMAASLKPGFHVMANTDEKNLDPNKLGVVRARLVDGAPAATTPGFRRTDFLLYSLNVVEERNDFDTLPFYPLYKKARALAASTEPGSWDQAKAGLATVYQEMLSSSDLTFQDAKRIFGIMKDELVETQESVKGLPELGPEERTSAREDLAGNLGLRRSDPTTDDRLDELQGASSLLRL
jgi:hypothetical protein